MTNPTKIALAALLLVAAPAAADRRNPLDGQPPLRKRVEMRSGRFELSPGVMTSLNQDFRNFVGFSLSAQYHIGDWIGIGGQVAFGSNTDTGLTSRLIGDDGSLMNSMNNGALPVAEAGLQPSRTQYYDHLANIKIPFSLYLALTPVAGKTAIFGAAYLRYDLYGMAGVGGMTMSNSWGNSSTDDTDPTCTGGDPNRCKPVNDGLKVGLMVGVGTHLFFNDWFGIHIELKDYVASTNPGGLDVNGDRNITSDDNTISHNLFVTAGFTFMFPLTAHISP